MAFGDFSFNVMPPVAQACCASKICCWGCSLLDQIAKHCIPENAMCLYDAGMLENARKSMVQQQPGGLASRIRGTTPQPCPDPPPTGPAGSKRVTAQQGVMTATASSQDSSSMSWNPVRLTSPFEKTSKTAAGTHSFGVCTPCLTKYCLPM